ncbi:unnamed protein product [Sphenostylis stenocarpa]|uniref:Uncharacterized protein n=1 Tax=Sphenostylis stenocarpa TaxID=92480 RepID=A0AA86TCY2_9FABA|nr:unnamed protein product [Sphenostylis stenocarpa]
MVPGIIRSPYLETIYLLCHPVQKKEKNEEGRAKARLVCLCVLTHMEIKRFRRKRTIENKITIDITE